MKAIFRTTATVFVFALVLAVSGCAYRGAKVVEGADLALGFSVPGTDGALQFQLFNYLSGFRLAVAENARLEVEYSTAETNTFLGCMTTRTTKKIHAVVEPCELSTTNSPAATDRELETTPEEPPPDA